METVQVNNQKLYWDLVQGRIGECKLVPCGYVGNRTETYEGQFHPDDSWAIDLSTEEGMIVDSYLYTSEYEYKQDLKALKL